MKCLISKFKREIIYYYNKFLKFERPHGKGKYWSTDNTKIGIKVDNSYQKKINSSPDGKHI